MKRLIQRGLMFGNLIHIASPALVERYNRALMHLTGKRTELPDFHIDISGFSPEVADELGDPFYLNHEGVNRQFILLTTEQRSAPLLNAQFDTSREVLKAFITENEAQLFALSAKDAVTGELLNSVFYPDTAARLLDMRRIEIEADTPEGMLARAGDLAERIDRFKREEDAWFDDVLIAEMIGLAKDTGDVIRNPVHLRQRVFEVPSFWTAHFGGMYVFRDVPEPAVIVCEPERVGDMPLRVIPITDHDAVALFLRENDLVESVVKARGINAAAILRQKMDFIVVDAASDAGIDLTGATRQDMRALTRRHARDLPPEFHGLGQLLNWAEAGGPWPRIDSGHPAYFYSLRAAHVPQRDLVNRLLSELAPKDVRQLFICHKELFYRLYATWGEAKKTYVADFLAREYQVDKAGARAALFGHDAPMDDVAPPPKDLVETAPRDMIARVGPWGAVRR